MTLTAERLRQVLHYNPETGVWTYLVKRGKKHIGDKAGTFNSGGYHQLYVDGKRYYGHRLAFLYQTGAWPENNVDHAERAPGDDRWSLLRNSTQSQNLANARKRKGNTTSRFKGVIFSKERNKWRANIRWQGRTHFLGRFNREENAALAYNFAALEHFGDFARYNHA